jgi:hypothetical protein
LAQKSRNPISVGFGAKDPSSVELIKDGFEADAFVELSPEEWDGSWESTDRSKTASLVRTSFTVFEDWRPQGWVWFGRYFKSEQTSQAIAFLRSVIEKPRSSSHSPDSKRDTEADRKAKQRIGQGDFKSEAQAIDRLERDASSAQDRTIRDVRGI